MIIIFAASTIDIKLLKINNKENDTKNLAELEIMENKDPEESKVSNEEKSKKEDK
jgi:hypothetical protein